MRRQYLISIGAALIGCAAGFAFLHSRTTKPRAIAVIESEQLSPAAKAVASSRSNADALYANKPKEAEAQYRQLIEAHANSKDAQVQDQVGQARLHLAYLESKRGDWDSARRTFIQTAKEYKGTGAMTADFGGIPDQAAYQAAACLMGAGKKDEAEKALVAFMKQWPLSPLVNAAHNRLRILNGGESKAEYDDLLNHDIELQEKKIAFETSVCGPKVIEELQARLNKPRKSYEDIAKLCGTTDKGTTIEGMRKALSALGFNSYALMLNRADFGSMPVPAIWLKQDHYLLVLNIDKNDALVYDPLYKAEHREPLSAPDDVDFKAAVITLQLPILKENAS